MLNYEWDLELLSDCAIDLPEIEIGDENKQIKEDLSDDINLTCKIEIECSDEREQETLYNEMTERGFVCRILTL